MTVIYEELLNYGKSTILRTTKINIHVPFLYRELILKWEDKVF